MRAVIEAHSWQRPPLFRWLSEGGAIAPAEMTRTFNCGIGMVAIVAEGDVDAATGLMAGHGETVHRIGAVVSAAGRTVSIDNTSTTWAANPTGPE